LAGENRFVLVDTWPSTRWEVICSMATSNRNTIKSPPLLSVVQKRFILFSGVGLSGVLLQIATLAFFHRSLNLPFLLGQTASVLVAMTSNFSLNNIITFREKRLRGRAWFRGLLSFCLACSIGALFNLAAAQLVYKFGAHYILAGLVGTGAGSIFNFVSVDRFTWKTARPASLPQPRQAP
jgi:dolichol-phosphate mannosyltransferase